MENCTISDLMESMSPWLSEDYIRGAGLDENGNFMLVFNDGVKNVYHIEDCAREQLIEILNNLKKKGVTILRPECP